ncbi:uncharacterized [Tachysurus ichikawai]
MRWCHSFPSASAFQRLAGKKRDSSGGDRSILCSCNKGGSGVPGPNIGRKLMPERASGHQRRLKLSPSMRHQWSGEGGDGGCEQRLRCLWGQAFNNDYKLERGTGPDRLQLWGRPPL